MEFVTLLRKIYRFRKLVALYVAAETVYKLVRTLQRRKKTV